MSKDAEKLKCVEHGVFTSPPARPAGKDPLDLAAIDPAENQRIISSGKMSFAMVGCTGDPQTPAATEAVAKAMIAADDTSFFYHLGDVIYIKKASDGSESGDTPALWNDQFYAPYSKYPKQIVSVPGNHDGKSTPITNYLGTFCGDAAQWPKPWQGNTTDRRPAMIQPNVYWRLDTPAAYFLGLYSNVVNGGMLDDPSAHPDFTAGPQYKWLVRELNAVAVANKRNSAKKAVLLAVHYPPYSGAANFDIRGDQSLGPTPSASNAPYLAVILQQAFTESGQRPDAIFSAHAHLFQRLTYTFADGTIMPCLVAGCGGHSPLEVLAEQCDGKIASTRPVPFPAVLPGSFEFPKGHSAQVEYYNDNESHHSQFGYLKVTVKARTLTCQFVGAKSGKIHDECTLDLETHKYR
jgi:acid phosphatase type 7